MWCGNCEEPYSDDELNKTAYGDYLCDYCWSDYICSEAGKHEYLIGICKGEYPVSDFDADFLGEVANSWRKHNRSLEFLPSERAEIEIKARELGIL